MSTLAKSFELPPDIAAELETVAVRRNRPIGEVLEDAVRSFLNDEAAFVEKVEAARANADAGNTVPWDEAERGFRETIARAAARRATA